MKRIKSTSNYPLEQKLNLNEFNLANKKLRLANISKEQKAISKLAFNQLPLKSVSEEIIAHKSITSLQNYNNHLQEKLNQFNHMYKKEKAWIKPIDIKSIEHLSALHQETKDRLLESNLFHLIVQKLTIDYLKTNVKKEEYTSVKFKAVKNEIASIYKLKLQLTLQETLIAYNDLLLEYLFNESDELTIYELLQLITVINEHSHSLKYYVKTIKGTGDCYAQRDNSDKYIEVELKSGDLDRPPLTKLRFKIKDNYLHLEEIFFFIDGDKDQIYEIMEDHNIIIPKHIELEIINTKKMFSDHNYEYFTPNSKDIAFMEIYDSLNKHSFKKEIDNLLKKCIIKDKIDLVKYEELLTKHYSLEWLKICQEVGETFIDLNKPITLSDNVKDTHVSPDNDN